MISDSILNNINLKKQASDTDCFETCFYNALELLRVKIDDSLLFLNEWSIMYNGITDDAYSLFQDTFNRCKKFSDYKNDKCNEWAKYLIDNGVDINFIDDIFSNKDKVLMKLKEKNTIILCEIQVNKKFDYKKMELNHKLLENELDDEKRKPYIKQIEKYRDKKHEVMLLNDNDSQLNIYDPDKSQIDSPFYISTNQFFSHNDKNYFYKPFPGTKDDQIKPYGCLIIYL